MAIRYLMTQQIVPNQGMSYTLYEIEGENTILRMLTTIPEVGKVSIYPKPPVKTLFAPERCMDSTEEEFKKLWEAGEAAKRAQT
jgi:hypothetical protein